MRWQKEWVLHTSRFNPPRPRPSLPWPPPPIPNTRCGSPASISPKIIEEESPDSDWTGLVSYAAGVVILLAVRRWSSNCGFGDAEKTSECHKSNNNGFSFIYFWEKRCFHQLRIDILFIYCIYTSKYIFPAIQESFCFCFVRVQYCMELSCPLTERFTINSSLLLEFFVFWTSFVFFRFELPAAFAS